MSTATPTDSRAVAAPAAVAFVGAGPGDPGLLTLAAVSLLGRADVVVTDRHTEIGAIRRHTRPDVEVVDASHGEHGKQLTHASRAKLVVQTAVAHPGGLVVRLMDGDPATFNGLAEESAACHKAGIVFDIVPGVSAVTAVPAYAGVPLTSPAVTAVAVYDAGREGADFSRAVDDAVTVVLLGQATDLEHALAALAEAGRSAATPVALIERGTTTEQISRITTLQQAVALMASHERVTLAIAGPTVRLHEQLSWFETKPLFAWRVLIPRTKDQAGSAVERLATHGAAAEVVPTISVEPPRTRHQMDKAITGLVTGRFEWVGFTSVNAVKAVRERLEEFGLDARAFAGLKIAAVGGVTADALRAWGLAPDLLPEREFSARGLLEVWPEYDPQLDPINRVFLPRADIATDTLVAGLQDLGWEVEDATAYRTVRAAPPPAPIREAIKTGDFDAAVFTSSSTVRNLIGIAGKPHASTVIACIGPATARTAEEHGLRVDVVAPEASIDALIDALADFGRRRAREAIKAGSPVLRPSAKRKLSGRRRAR